MKTLVLSISYHQLIILSQWIYLFISETRYDHTFVELHNVCDTLFRQLHSDGVGSETKETSVIMKDEENKLWSYGILGLHSPKSLLRTTFF